MAYDPYESRRGWRDPRTSRPRDDRFGDREDRGFFERAGDEIASWFGDEEAERRRLAERGDREDWRDRPARDDRFGRPPATRDEELRRPYTGRMTSRGDFAGRYGFGSAYHGDTFDRGSSQRFSERGGFDPQYGEWRQRQIDSLDRDYDEYRRENQSRFERDFAGWRDQRQTKRQLLGQIREHMEVLGSDNEHVGTVDRVAGDRLILTKSDPEAGGIHHSLMCTTIERIEGDKVILDTSAEQAKARWRDESRDRALFEREDQGEAGPHILDRSFSGTYR
ncbi:MAG TPA: DUF2171 domain-containing protein [Sphingomicrobium sp.]|nr:DUF2171 domain-containing protein [Sphingomicrobium sp.]